MSQIAKSRSAKPKPAPQHGPAAHPRKKKVRFQLKKHADKGISLVGTFTGWTTEPIPLVEIEPDLWSAEVDLPPGRHEYRFVVDGGEWLSDPAATLSVANPWDGFNSVLIVHD